MSEDTFLTDVCDWLFGCHLKRVGPSIEKDHDFECSCCEEPIDIKKWVHANHKSDCIILKVREHLIEHRPQSVPHLK
jgi:hypothetical protein